MSDGDQITAVGETLTAALIDAYGATVPNSSLVFLPSISVPNDLIQNGVINPTQVQTFLAVHVDAPVVMSPSGREVHGIDLSHGKASQIYKSAVSYALPVGNPSEDNWKRVSELIKDAKASFGAGDVPNPVVCEPDDWFLPANSAYWNTFDSAQTRTTVTQPQSSLPLTLRPQFWMVGTREIEPASIIPSPTKASPPQPATTGTVISRSDRPGLKVDGSAYERRPANLIVGQSLTLSQPTMRQSPQVLTELAPHRLDVGTTNAKLTTIQPLQIWFHPIDPIPVFKPGSSSTITLHLEHQYVTLAYLAAGVSWWDGVFLADQGWYIPGLPRGALLPLPSGNATAADDGLVYGMPVAMVIVRNLRISGHWSDEAKAALNSPGGVLGPFSLHGATQNIESDGSVTYSHDGMQVVAMFCSKLPVLPPVDTPPSLNATPADSSTVPATSSAAGTASNPDQNTGTSQSTNP
jgi:hypothetical protein